MLGGGVPYCPWWGGPWGEHGVYPFDEPLRAGGRSRSGYHVVVPARRLGCGGGRRGGQCRGLVRWPVPTAPGGSNPLGRPSPGPCRRRTVPRRVTLMPVSCVRAWPHSMGGIQTCLPWVCLRARQSTRSTMASWRPLPGVVRSRRALTVSLVQSSCRRYQPGGGGRGPAFEGSSEEVGVADGGRCEGGVPRVRGGWAGWAAGVLRVYVDV